MHQSFCLFFEDVGLKGWPDLVKRRGKGIVERGDSVTAEGVGEARKHSMLKQYSKHWSGFCGKL